MSDVKRYWAFGFVDDETGEDSTEQVLVVLATDYDALRAEVERLRGDLSETRIALANAECREGVAKARLAEAQKDAREWKEAALSLGERLSLAGPTSYYSFAPFQWLDWAVSAIDAARAADSAVEKP